MLHQHYAVIGDPISHSLSPLLHQTAFNLCYPHNSTDFPTPSYFAYHVKKEELAEFMRMFRGEIANNFTPLSNEIAPKIVYSKTPFNKVQHNKIPHNKTLQTKTPPYTPMAGLSVTLPHKKEIMQYADLVTAEAELAGAANTLYWEDGKLIADNTDIVGFLAPLKAIPTPKNALILGAGGAAAAVLVGLLKLAHKQNSELKEIFVCARREEQAQELIVHITSAQEKITQSLSPCVCIPQLRILPYSQREKPVDLVVNTIPASLAGQNFTPRTDFQHVRIAYDLLYAQTSFVQEAQKAGIHTITGEEMFLEQGAQQFLLWTKMRIPYEAFTAVRNKINA